MHTAHIIKVQLTLAARSSLSYKTYTEAEGWLESWTPKGNVKAAIADSLDGCLHILATDLGQVIPQWMKDRGLKVQHLEFRVCDQPVEDGRFWPGSFENRFAFFSAEEYLLC